jgi:hypothetical protein
VVLINCFIGQKTIRAAIKQLFITAKTNKQNNQTKLHGQTPSSKQYTKFRN